MKKGKRERVRESERENQYYLSIAVNNSLYFDSTLRSKIFQFSVFFHLKYIK